MGSPDALAHALAAFARDRQRQPQREALLHTIVDAAVRAQRESALERALVSRELVGQAQGILMERDRVTADQAFAALQGASQRRNLKLAEVASRLVETGDLRAAFTPARRA